MNLLIETIESDRYPLSPLVRVLKNILTKFGELGGLSPELAQRPRRYAPATPAPQNGYFGLAGIKASRHRAGTRFSRSTVRWSQLPSEGAILLLIVVEPTGVGRFLLRRGDQHRCLPRGRRGQSIEDD